MSARATSWRKAEARKLAKSGWQRLEPITRGEKGVAWPAFATRAFWNNHFTVLVNDKAGVDRQDRAIIQAYVVPHHAGREVFWRDLQRVKDEVFGEETTAIQYFPAQSRRVDEANVYWLYVLPEGAIPVPMAGRA